MRRIASRRSAVVALGALLFLFMGSTATAFATPLSSATTTTQGTSSATTAVTSPTTTARPPSTTTAPAKTPHSTKTTTATTKAPHSTKATTAPAKAPHSTKTTTAPAKAPGAPATTTTTTTTLPATARHGPIPNWVAVAQTVAVSNNADGSISGKPVVFTQLTANGSSAHTVKVPMSSSGLRNLVGLRRPPIEDGKAVWNLDLNGPTTERTISHFQTSSLPLKVSVTYWLNGKKMKASDIVGKSGLLKTTYTVQNVTTKKTSVTFKNIFGVNQTMATSVPIPVAAAFSITFPSSFTNLRLPGASTYGLGNGTLSASWTLFTFEPLGSLTQSVSYEAQVTNAMIPSATLEAEVVPPQDLQSLPSVSVPGQPAIPTVTVGVHLSSIQAEIQAELQKISAAASNLLSEFQAVAVPAAQDVSNGAAKSALDLATLSSDATNAATTVGQVSSELAQHAANVAQVASNIATAQANLSALPAAICNGLNGTPIPVTSNCPSVVEALPVYQFLQAGFSALNTLVVDLADGLSTTSTAAQNLQLLLATTVSTDLSTASSDANVVSEKALELSNTLANLTLAPSSNSGAKTVQPKEIGGGADLDAAVAQLDAAITEAGNTVDTNYAYLDALNYRGGQNLLPAGNASGASVQDGLVLYSISGADQTQHLIHLATIIGVTALSLGATIGLGLYRIRKGWPSSLAPTKKT